jgi:dynein light chain roadblock-type
MVWSFLKAAGHLVDELDKEDEVRLLRLRTKKNELVIVPGTESSTIAIAIH